MKKVLVFLSLSIASLQADWLDDLSELVTPQASLSIIEATSILKQIVLQDEKEVAWLEKTMKQRTENGFWAALRGGTYHAQVTAARTNLNYHQKVMKVLSELPANKNGYEKLAKNLLTLKNLRTELAALKAEYAKTHEVGTLMKLGARIAAKEVQIKGEKTLIKSAFIF